MIAMPIPAGVLANDPTVAIECHRPDDRFVPLHPQEMAEPALR